MHHIKLEIYDFQKTNKLLIHKYRNNILVIEDEG